MRFTESHEWVSQDGSVGITTHARKELGEIVYVELPKVGQVVEAGEEVAVVESTKAAVDICAPVSGEIIEVNEKLASDASLINKDPQETGWLFKLKISKTEQVKELLDHVQYLALIR